MMRRIWILKLGLNLIVQIWVGIDVFAWVLAEPL